MKALILASLPIFFAVAQAATTWSGTMGPDQERVAIVEASSSGYPGIVRVLICIPKGQKGFGGREITTANLRVYEGELLVFGALLEVIDLQREVRMTFEIPERHLLTTDVRLQPFRFSPVTYVLQINDHLDSDGQLPNRKNNQAEQGDADQPATAPESKPEGNEKPQPKSEGRSQ